MTSDEWGLIKRLVAIVFLTALFPLGALAYRFLLMPPSPVNLTGSPSPALYTLVPGASNPQTVTPAPPTPMVLVVPSGWKEQVVESEHFALALPPRWQRLPVDPTELEGALKSIRDSNPELAAVLGERGKQLVQSGVKFWAFDLTPEALKSKFATNLTITHQTLPNEVSFDAYVLVNVNQINQLSTREGPVIHQRVALANLPAEKIAYSLLYRGSDGGTTISSITQYLALSRTDSFVLTFATSSEQVEQYSSTFDQIAATFRILEQ